MLEEAAEIIVKTNFTKRNIVNCDDGNNKFGCQYAVVLISMTEKVYMDIAQCNPNPHHLMDHVKSDTKEN